MTADEPREASGLDDYFGAVDEPVQSAVVDHSTQVPEQPGEDGVTRGASVVRSAEQLAVHTVTEASQRVRLRKFIVSEDVTTTVTVLREEVRLERVSLTDDDVDLADGHELSEVDYELVLFGERVVVTKEVVPIERIRLSKTVQTREQQVDATVRSEQVEVDRTAT